MLTFTEYLTEALYPIKEDEPHKKRRQKSDYSHLITVDAKKFKTQYEKDNGEKLDWKPQRLEALRRLVNSGQAINDHPIVSRGRSLSVGDGRHRISHAAERGEKIKVAIPPEEKHKYEDLK